MSRRILVAAVVILAMATMTTAARADYLLDTDPITLAYTPVNHLLDVGEAEAHYIADEGSLPDGTKCLIDVALLFQPQVNSVNAASYTTGTVTCAVTSDPHLIMVYLESYDPDDLRFEQYGSKEFTSNFGLGTGVEVFPIAWIRNYTLDSYVLNRAHRAKVCVDGRLCRYSNLAFATNADQVRDPSQGGAPNP